MKKSIAQIRKLRGTNKASNSIVNNVYFIENVVFWTDGSIFYKNEIDFDFKNAYSSDLKGLYDVVKSVKTIDNLELKNDILIINNCYQIRLTKEKSSIIPENIFTSELLNQNILTLDNSKELKAFINAVSKTEYGVLKNISVKNNKLAVTDGNRLNIFNNIKTIDNKEYLLPSILIEKNLNKNINIYVDSDNKYISTVYKNEIIVSRLDDGIYPKYEQLIPNYETESLKFNKKELLPILKNMKNLVNTRTKVVVLDFVNNKIKSVKDELLNEIDFNFNYDGKLSFVAFNVDYLIDMVNYMDDDFTLKLSDISNLACGIFESNNKTTLLMPVRITGNEKTYNLVEKEKEPETEKEEVIEPEIIETPEPEEEKEEKEEIIESEIVENKKDEIIEPVFEKEISIDSPECIEMKKQFDEINEKMVNSPEYKELINKNEPEKEKGFIRSIINKVKQKVKETIKKPIEKNHHSNSKHINAVTGHVYGGYNIEILDSAGFKSNEWVGMAQAKKLGKQVKADAKGTVIKIYYIDDEDRTFCKHETVYNIEELEPLQKTENTQNCKDMVKRLKAV